ncbi:MAG: T9SS type A sorting domain-containing protein [Bacteroidales bacterium]|nr:T9SS type A sorting domain-containing protein [Bacteroidales bacterium]
MKQLYFIAALVLSVHLFGQIGMIQNMNLSKKDSIRLKNVPELKTNPSFFLHKSSLPTVVDNSTQPYWRGIYWQSGCSCGQASSEGYVFTYEIDRKRDLDATLDENRYPYSFTYNFLNIGNTVCGASWLESQDIIREAGIPNLPTNGGVMTDGGMKLWLNGYEKYYDAMHNRINDVYGIFVGSPEGLDVLKNWLDNHLENSPIGGLAFFYANHVSSPEVLAAGTPEEGKHIITAFSNTSHSMTIVGYNDEVRYDYNNDGQYTNDIDITGDGIVDMRDWEIGALKIANTYNGGSSPFVWADQGFCYVMYRILPYHNSQGGIWDKRAYVSDVKEEYEPLLTAKVNLTYDSRDKIKVMAGVSTNLSATFPDHIEEFPHFRFQGDALYMQGGTTTADKTIEFGLDLSELLNYVDSNQAAKYFLFIKEDDSGNVGTGQVNSFSIIDYTNGATEYTSSQTNVPITDNGNTILSVDATIEYSDVQIITDTVPKAELNNAYSAQIEAQGGTEPYRWFPFYDYRVTSIANTFVPITGTTVSGSYDNIHLNFDFPFYGKTYNSGSVNQYGALMFEYEDSNVPYDRDYSVLMRYFKAIAPFYGYSSSATIKYEGTSSYAKIYWNATFDGYTYQYMITLFPDGTIYIDYGSGTSPNDPEWSAGVTKGDQISYQEFDFSSQSFPSNTRLILEPRPFPTGLNIDDNGLIYGTITEEFTGDSIFVKVVDNNWLTDVRGFLFTNRGLLFSNYITETPDNNILEYGETAQLSLDLSNVGEASINNINLKLHTYDDQYNLVDSLDFLSTLSLGATHSFNQAFEFDIDNHVSDNTLLNFVVEAEADEVSAFDTISFIVRAPVINVINTEFADGGDNILDPGETGDLLITYKNIGGSEATNLVVAYTPTDAYVTINSVSNNTKAELSPDSTWVVTLNITAHNSTPEGYVSTIDSDIDADKEFHADNDVLVGIGLIIENWETGTTDAFPWGTSGNADWYIDNTTVHEGNYALRSGDINDNEISTLSLIGTVATSGNISFYKKVSSEINYDYLKFYIDSIVVAEWCGDLDWSEHVFPVTAGLHSFEWKYEKDGSVSTGSDAAWIDYIVFPAIDFSDPVMEVDQTEIEKWMAPNETDTDTITVRNIGGGLLTYSATIDNAVVAASVNPYTTSSLKSIAGSTLIANPNSFYTGMPITIDLTVSNASTDSEWLKNLVISFPLGVTLDSATAFVGGTGGNMDWDNAHGNGSDVSWFGEDASGWGVVKGNESATSTLYLTIDPAIQNSVILQYTLDGDIYGADPHTITDFLVLSNNGTNDTWLTFGENSGSVIANQDGFVLLNFNTFGIPEGTYNCIVSIFSNVDSVDVPITLHVQEPTNIAYLSSNIQVYPNPARDYIIIDPKDKSPKSLIIFNAIGQEVLSETIVNKQNISTYNWPRGMYLLVLRWDDQQYTKSIIVE